jgi:gag-polyprotein putative aspartyl protease
MMPAYDEHFFTPPAPLARVTLRQPENGTIVSDVPMLLDSGADVTLIPQASVARLGLTVRVNESYELMGFDGSISQAQAVQLDLIFLRRRFKGRFLVSMQEWGIIGRDILNHVSLLLDGPHLTWNEQNASRSRNAT